MSIAVVPLMALAASTTGLVASPASAPAARTVASPLAAPLAPEVPNDALEAPASGTTPHAGPDRGLHAVAGVRTVSAAGLASIPDVALAAYQRAEAVMSPTDASCRLPWQLLAAIGRVESDHGRHAGSGLSRTGVATPPILGPRLDGRTTARIRDTDAGTLDGDRRFDRAVGPMQFIPSTWSAVGVDADSDGRRDPQDVDDAALAAGVYLCAGSGDLSTDVGLREALLRYNHSDAYVRLVLELMAAYDAASADADPLLARRIGPLTVPADVASAMDRVDGGSADATQPVSARTDRPDRVTRADGGVDAVAPVADGKRGGRDGEERDRDRFTGEKDEQGETEQPAGDEKPAEGTPGDTGGETGGDAGGETGGDAEEPGEEPPPETEEPTEPEEPDCEAESDETTSPSDSGSTEAEESSAPTPTEESTPTDAPESTETDGPDCDDLDNDNPDCGDPESDDPESGDPGCDGETESTEP